VDSSLIGVLFAGITGLIAAISTFNTNQNRKNRSKVKLLTIRTRTLETQVVDLLSHLFKLEQMMAHQGMKVPERPKSLEIALDVEDDSV
jgi:hypothetical protein